MYNNVKGGRSESILSHSPKAGAICKKLFTVFLRLPCYVVNEPWHTVATHFVSCNCHIIALKKSRRRKFSSSIWVHGKRPLSTLIASPAPQDQKAPLPVNDARAVLSPMALGDLMWLVGSTSLMFSGDTDPFIMLAAMSS